jgi:hypothetical protein
MPQNENDGEETAVAGIAIVETMLRTRMLQVLNSMMEHTGEYGQLVGILQEIAGSYRTWLNRWGGDVMEGADGMERICEQREKYGEIAEFPQRYVAAYMNAQTRLVYFLGRYEAEMLEDSHWRQVAEETTEELLGYALSQDPLERLGIKEKSVAKCFPYRPDWSKFRRDALLAAAYAKIALARLPEEDPGEDSRAAASLREARLALLDARQLTEELRQEELKENDKVGEGVGTHKRLLIATDTEKRNFSEISDLLDRVKSF